MKLLNKIINSFKSKYELLDLIEEQAIKIQDLEEQKYFIKQEFKSFLENS